MSTPYVPPYFGSYEEIVNARLHDPFLGSGRSHRLPQTHIQADELNPQPLPPRGRCPIPGRTPSAIWPHSWRCRSWPGPWGTRRLAAN